MRGTALAVSLFFHLGIEDQRGEIAEDEGGSAAGSACAEASGKQPQRTCLIHRLLHALKQIVSKTQKGHGGARAREFQKGLVDAERSQHGPGTDQKDHDPARHQLCLFHQDLDQGTDQPSDPECVQIIHIQLHFRRSRGSFHINRYRVSMAG